ncbi:MAG TPA: hypothetical protein VM802_24430 [Chitinophaga sp.]|uniref:Ig-like domain-containing protein n=1 Tax=Chitinophaga sp. TaxID=1869181 RepID=UPI002BD4DC77|nr:hypothetical protein [Chitinophaga sp.]HVI48038.1 hypothetical protein [Chitinophaga sp.]
MKCRNILNGILLLLLLCTNIKICAQRVFANSQSTSINGICLLCSVSDPGNAVDSNLNNYSTFNLIAGILGVKVSQTLNFPYVSNAPCDSLVVRIGNGATIISLSIFDAVTIETFNNNVSNNDLRVVSSTPIRLLSDGTKADIILRPLNAYNAVKISVNSSLLGLLGSLRIYYAYKSKVIVPAPTYSIPPGINCDVMATISNYQPGVYYNVRLKSTLPTGLYDTTYVSHGPKVYFPVVRSIGSKTVTSYVQAVDSVSGCVSDTSILSFVQGSTDRPATVPQSVYQICERDSINIYADAFLPAYQLLWYSSLHGGRLLHVGSPFKVAPTDTMVYYVTTKLVCENPDRVPVTVNTIPQPPKPAYVLPGGVNCRVTFIVTNHTSGKYYNARVKYVLAGSIPSYDTTFIVHGNQINVPLIPSIGAHNVETYIQAVDSITGCVSDTANGVFAQAGAGALPVVPVDSFYIQRGDSVIMSALTTPPHLAVWYDAPQNGTLLFTGNQYKVSPAITTVYYVTNKLNCDNVIRIPVTVFVSGSFRRAINSNRDLGSTDDIQTLLNLVEIYPIPARGFLRFNGVQRIMLKAPLRIRVIGMNGIIHQTGILNSEVLHLSPTMLPGLYLLEISSDNGYKVVRKFILKE